MFVGCDFKDIFDNLFVVVFFSRKFKFCVDLCRYFKEFFFDIWMV